MCVQFAPDDLDLNTGVDFRSFQCDHMRLDILADVAHVAPDDLALDGECNSVLINVTTFENNCYKCPSFQRQNQGNMPAPTAKPCDICIFRTRM